MHKLFLRGAVIAVTAVAISLLLYVAGFLEPIEKVTWDLRVKTFVDQESVSDEIVIVMLDQDSLEWAESEQGLSWPWPREVVTTIVNFVTRAGAKSVSFDVVYTEPSLYGVWDDTAFVEAVKESDIFVSAAILSHEKSNTWDDSLPYQDVNIKGLDDWISERGNNLKVYGHLTYPIHELAINSDRLANVHSDPDSDGIYRKGGLFYLFNDRVVPSMALASYITGGSENLSLSVEGNTFYINDKKIPLTQNGDVVLNFKGSYPKIKAAKVIQSEIQVMSGEKPSLDPSLFKDKYVFFGYSATGLLDLRSTPLNNTGSGVEVHAVMLDNLISNDFITRITIRDVIIYVFIFSLLIGVLYTRFQGPVKGVIFFIVFLSVPLLLSVVMYKSMFWFPVVFTEVSILLTLSLSGLVNYATEGKQKREIKNAFKQYLSPIFIEDILKDPDKLKLGGEKKELSIFFSDLEGFTSISERLSPEELTNLINVYLSAMTDIIMEEGGTIDKYEGDAIIAFWNAPVSYEDHAVRSVRAALRCQDKLKSMREYFIDLIGCELKMRIGINTGEAVVGNMGSNTRFDYTMLGDAVNLASRLEGVNKLFNTYTIISESTKNQIVNTFPVKEISNITVVGKDLPVRIFEPVTSAQYESEKELYDIFANGLKAFYVGKFEEAITQFSKISSRDKTAEKYIRNCSYLIENGPKNWDGVLKVKNK